MRKVRVLLTATVTPQPVPYLHAQDPAERRRAYVDSLRRWVPAAERLGATVAFYENSGEDLDRLARDAFGAVPGVLTLHPRPVPSAELVARGKGATEAAMMDAFVADHATDADELWLKCTGRLHVQNLDRCLPADVPAPGVVARLTVDLRRVDTRFFGASSDVWRARLTGAGPEVDDVAGTNLEHVLARRLLHAIADGTPLLRFRTQPALVGSSGSYANGDYDSLRSTAQRLVANGVEKLLRGPLYDKHF